jgi:hypothetical protein
MTVEKFTGVMAKRALSARTDGSRKDLKGGSVPNKRLFGVQQVVILRVSHGIKIRKSDVRGTAGKVKLGKGRSS